MPEQPSPAPPDPGRPADGPMYERTVVSADDIDRVVQRIAHELLERNRSAADLVLLGIPTRGVPLAERDRRRAGGGGRRPPAHRAPSTSRCTATTCATTRRVCSP